MKFTWLDQYEKRAFTFMFAGFVWAVSWILGMYIVQLFKSDFIEMFFGVGMITGYLILNTCALWNIIKSNYYRIKKW